jgi:hypothetical protein
LADQERQGSFHNISGGGAVHLVDVYAQNAVREIIQNARIIISNERGRYTLPSEFVDQLVMDCERWVLANGPTEAERAVCGRITEFLDQRKRFKHEDDERKVKKSLERSTIQASGPPSR